MKSFKNEMQSDQSDSPGPFHLVDRFHQLTMCDAIAFATSRTDVVQNEENEPYGLPSPVANGSSVAYKNEMGGEHTPINEFTRLVGEIDKVSWRRPACCRTGDVSESICS